MTVRTRWSTGGGRRRAPARCPLRACSGKTNAEIGAALGISERTIDKHLKHELDKLGLENRAAVAAFALEATAG